MKKQTKDKPVLIGRTFPINHSPKVLNQQDMSSKGQEGEVQTIGLRNDNNSSSPSFLMCPKCHVNKPNCECSPSSFEKDLYKLVYKNFPFDMKVCGRITNEIKSIIERDYVKKDEADTNARVEFNKGIAIGIDLVEKERQTYNR